MFLSNLVNLSPYLVYWSWKNINYSFKRQKSYKWRLHHMSDLLFFPQMPSIVSTSWRTIASCRAWWSWPITVTVLPARGWWSAAGRSGSPTCKHWPSHSSSDAHGVALRRAQEICGKAVNVHYGNVFRKVSKGTDDRGQRHVASTDYLPETHRS